MKSYEIRKLQNIVYECSLDKKNLQLSIDTEQAKLAEIQRVEKLYFELYENLIQKLSEVNESYGSNAKVYSSGYSALSDALFHDWMFKSILTFSEAKIVYQKKIVSLVNDSDALQRRMNRMTSEIGRLGRLE